MNEIGYSTRRCGHSLLWSSTPAYARFRLRDITTNTLLKFGQALSVELLCSLYVYLSYHTSSLFKLYYGATMTVRELKRVGFHDIYPSMWSAQHQPTRAAPDYGDRHTTTGQPM